MRIYFDIIFIVLNIIIFAVNFHFALESKSSKAYTYAILGMSFAIAAIILLPVSYTHLTLPTSDLV